MRHWFLNGIMKCMFPFNSLLSAYVVDIFLLYALESYLEHTHINPEQAICVHFPNSWRTNVLNARVHYRVHSAVAVCSGSQLFVWNSNVLQERWGKWALDFTVIKTFISHILHTCKTSKCYNTYLKVRGGLSIRAIRATHCLGKKKEKKNSWCINAISL